MASQRSLLPLWLCLWFVLRFADAWVNRRFARPRPLCSVSRPSRSTATRCESLSRHSLALKAAEKDNQSTDESSPSSTFDMDSLMEMDCFVYSRKVDGTKKMELGVLEESVLQPICAWTMEEAFDDYIEFVVDEEDRYSVDMQDVTVHSLIPSDSLSYGSRQVGGGKGPGNPHGEESELLYYIRKEALEGIEVTVKPELEITW